MRKIQKDIPPWLLELLFDVPLVCVFFRLSGVLFNLPQSICSVLFYTAFFFSVFSSLILFFLSLRNSLLQNHSFLAFVKKSFPIFFSLAFYCICFIVLLTENSGFSFNVFKKFFLDAGFLFSVVSATVFRPRKTSIFLFVLLGFCLSIFAFIVFVFKIGSVYYSSTNLSLTFNFPNPNETGIFLAVILLIDLFSFFFFKKTFLKIVSLLLSAVILCFLYLTKSRNSLIAVFLLLFSLFLVYFLRAKKPILLSLPFYFLLIMVVMPFAYTIVGILSNGFSSFITVGLSQKSYGTRYYSWLEALSDLSKNPFFGSYLLAQKESTYLIGYFNGGMDLFIEYGFLGGLFELSLILVCFLRVGKNIQMNATSLASFLFSNAIFLISCFESGLFFGTDCLFVFTSFFLASAANDQSFSPRFLLTKRIAI